MKISEISFSSLNADLGFLPTLGPVYLPLYGSLREFSEIKDKYKDLDKGYVSLIKITALWNIISGRSNHMIYNFTNVRFQTVSSGKHTHLINEIKWNKVIITNHGIRKWTEIYECKFANRYHGNGAVSQDEGIAYRGRVLVELTSHMGVAQPGLKDKATIPDTECAVVQARNQYLLIILVNEITFVSKLLVPTNSTTE